MTVEMRPLGVRCNLGCEYCYQEPERLSGNDRGRYSIEAMIATADEHDTRFSVFGGEPLLVPIRDLERIWRFGLHRFGQNGIQTNGTLITERHYELFQKYKVHVGFSIDGPDELNAVRASRSKSRTTLELTRRSCDWLRRCLSENLVSASLIVTLTRSNAAPDRRDRLLRWLSDLDGQGLKSARIHLLESEDDQIRKKWGLTPQENIEVLDQICALGKELKNIQFDILSDIRKLLLGRSNDVTCVWNSCDFLNTRAVQGIESDGSSSNCGRTNKEGVDYVKADGQSFERSLALYFTPQTEGGCNGCRWFAFCRGHCPGTAIDQDWRNRTEHCEVWKHLFERVEDDLLSAGIQPISDDLGQREALEWSLLRQWTR